ncbi:hypothetical protein SSX86_022751 [Deinandra increscens subsp. villosa]|uniref:Retrotransposon gag domain-containing protein n=1 Tax=Deinandra increscens subsp. villosa TaxID=3103831 RepID=A0AAP0GRG7_9ASTR
MAARRTVHEQASAGVTEARFAIAQPAIANTANWQVPSHVINTLTHSIQFHGREDEDAPTHISRFIRICNTFGLTGVANEIIYLRLFPFSLTSRAAEWLETLPPNSIATWDDLTAKFLKKYHPPAKAARTREEIHSFKMDPDEPYSVAYERFNTLLSRCPQHGLTEWAIIEKFYNGLPYSVQKEFNISAGGHMMEKLTVDECKSLFECFALAEQQAPGGRRATLAPTRSLAPSTSTRGVHHIGSETIPPRELENIYKTLEEIKLHIKAKCELCRGAHDTRDCPLAPAEQVDYIGNRNQFGNSFQSGWRSGQNSGWREGGNPPGFPPRNNYGGGDAGPTMKEITELVMNQTQILQQMNARDEATQKKLAEHDTLLRNQQASFLDLQRSVGDIAKQLKELNSRGGQFSGSTYKNPNANVNAITTRSGRVVHSPSPAVDDEEPVDEEIELETPGGRVHESVTPASTAPNVEAEIVREKPLKWEAVKEKKRVRFAPKPITADDLKRVPYPERLVQQKNAREYGQFLELLKQLRVTLPFTDVIRQMPKYAKFLKDMLTNKKKLENFSDVTLDAQCSAMVQNRLPEKLTDPGTFTIPCSFGDLSVTCALADLSASINVMPYSVFMHLGLGELEPTRMTISLADRSVVRPKGIVENVLVQVDKFLFPIDFVVVDTAYDASCPLILGRPFLRTARALVDVFAGTITLRVDDESVEFRVGKSGDKNSESVCFLGSFISLVDSCVSYVTGEDLVVGNRLEGERVVEDKCGEDPGGLDALIDKNDIFDPLVEPGDELVDGELVVVKDSLRRATLGDIGEFDYRIVFSPSVGRLVMAVSESDPSLGFLGKLRVIPGRFKHWRVKQWLHVLKMVALWFRRLTGSCADRNQVIVEIRAMSNLRMCRSNLQFWVEIPTKKLLEHKRDRKFLGSNSKNSLEITFQAYRLEVGRSSNGNIKIGNDGKKVDLEIISKETIKPSSPTPHHLRTFNFSIIDQIFYDVYIPLILFLPNTNKASLTDVINQRSKRLKESLSKVLTRFYPLAGIIKDNLQIDCNDEGIGYIEARVEHTLEEFLACPDDEKVRGLTSGSRCTADTSIENHVIGIQVCKLTKYHYYKNWLS